MDRSNRSFPTHGHLGVNNSPHSLKRPYLDCHALLLYVPLLIVNSFCIRFCAYITIQYFRIAVNSIDKTQFLRPHFAFFLPEDGTFTHGVKASGVHDESTIRDIVETYEHNQPVGAMKTHEHKVRKCSDCH